MTRFPTRTTAEQRLFDCNQWTETQFQNMIIDLAKRLGWMYFHVHDSRRSIPGWPDLVLVHPVQHRLLFWELKSAKGRPTSAQLAWLAALRTAGATVGVKKPEDWANESIQRELAARPAITGRTPPE